MKVRRLIDGASFGPDALKVITQAFDAAWDTIEGNFGTDPATIEAARLLLANAVLSVASNDSRDVEVLKNAALQVMAEKFRSGP
jgi:hypothetical protein